MPDIDQHMDDLLRRAAELYPLKMPEDDWNQVASALPPAKTSGSGMGTRRLAITGLLLLAGFLLFQLADKKETAGLPTPSPVSARAKSYRPAPSGMDAASVAALQTPQGIAKSPAAPGLEMSSHAGNNDARQVPDAFVNSRFTLLPREVTLPRQSPTRLPDISPGLATPASLPQKTNLRSRQTGFYLGLQAGLEWNTVKNQGFRTGYHGGLAIGYRINNNFGLEAGLILSRKRYYSDGKYFDTRHMPGNMPAGMKILSLNGTSTVIELPVALNMYPARRSGRLGQPVITLGITSYLQTDELNQYQISLNGNPDQMTGKYRSDRRYGAATLFIGAGTEKSISQKTSIRIAPYIQIPLKGIGIGSMPVWSAGIRFGLNRKIH